MTRDEIEYMLTNSEETWMLMRLKCCKEFFSLDEMMAREVMVPPVPDVFMVDINDDTKEIIESILSRTFTDSGL